VGRWTARVPGCEAEPRRGVSEGQWEREAGTLGEEETEPHVASSQEAALAAAPRVALRLPGPCTLAAASRAPLVLHPKRSQLGGVKPAVSTAAQAQPG